MPHVFGALAVLAVVLAAAVVLWVALAAGNGDTDDAGTRDDPLAMGTDVDLGNGWSVTVNSADTSADDQVAAAEEYNEPAPPGRRYVVVNLTAENTGGRPGAPEVEVSLFGSTGAESDGGNFVTPPEPRFDTVSEVEPGGSTTGNLVFEVATAETDLEARVQPVFSVDGTEAWVSIGD